MGVQSNSLTHGSHPIWSPRPSYLDLISQNKKNTDKQKQEANSRAILIASVEDHEGVGFSKEVLLIQFVGTELHCGVILQTGGGGDSEKWERKKRQLLVLLLYTLCVWAKNLAPHKSEVLTES